MIILATKKHGFLKGLLITLGLVSAGAAAVAVEQKVAKNKKVQKAVANAKRTVAKTVKKATKKSKKK